MGKGTRGNAPRELSEPTRGLEGPGTGGDAPAASPAPVSPPVSEPQTAATTGESAIDLAEVHRMAAEAAAGFPGHLNEALCGKLRLHVTELASGELREMLAGVTGLRKLLGKADGPPIDEVIESGVVPALIRMLRLAPSPGPQRSIVFEAAWCVTNIASGDHRQAAYVVERDAVPALLPLLRSNDPELVEQAAWAIGNISGDSTEFRDLVLSAGTLDVLCPIMMRGSRPTEDECQRLSISAQRTIAWTASNLMRGKPGPSLDYARQILAPIAAVITATDDEILSDAGFCICCVCPCAAGGPTPAVL